MKRFLRTAAMSFAIFSSLTACASTNPSDTSYWFSEHSTNYVKYSEEASKDDSFGTFWYFTSAKTCTMNFYVRIDLDAISRVDLYINSEKANVESAPGIFSAKYALSLQKGDKLKLRAYVDLWTSVKDRQFEISSLAIENGGKTYSLTEFDKSVKA